MRQVVLKEGQACLEEVPVTTLQPGQVLVEVAYSLISAGTERAALERSGMNLMQRALAQKDRVAQVLDYARDRGVRTAFSMVRAKLEAGSKPGYSCAGRVVSVGRDVDGLETGDQVACAGAGYAVHAEVVAVPRNLVVGVPKACSLRDAASATIGAIALQGVRRADVRLGETVAVIGLGLVGQLTVQLLKASGCRVIGIDLDASRVALAEELGLNVGLTPDEETVARVQHLTGGHGVDATVITAASRGDAIVQQAMHLTRKKGRVVIVGDVGLGLQRSPFYEKEIDFLISTSYGPGRYDPTYEEMGQDYPFAYVRWTENRNMQAYLQLVAKGQIRLERILTAEFPLDEAEAAFAALQAEEPRPLGVLLSYPPAEDERARQRKLTSRITLQPGAKKRGLNVAVIGASGFARGVHLPHLSRMPGVHVRAVVTGHGDSAKEVGKQFGVDYASTDYREVLADVDIDAVIIASRHNLHAEMTIAAAEAGKAIFLEKPMALNEEELQAVVQAVETTGVPFMVGFNRRFSPAARRVREKIKLRSNPLVAVYRVNAGLLPPTHWVHTKEGGGRIIGEACHMLDLFRYWVGAPVMDVTAQAISPRTDHVLSTDNFCATLKYEDGSVCTLIYTALGAKALPKEYVEAHCDGVSYVIDDFRELRVVGGRGGWRGGQDKGHKAEAEAFVQFVRGKGQRVPITLDQIVQVTRLALRIHYEVVRPEK
jgi:predicted dehydrogenase/threonine dehydrogenase-like Zn-dependent dehydrogenase